MNMDIPQNIRVVMNRLESSGHSAYLVGGCVRDAALGSVPHDYDVTTDALPNEILKIFDGFKVIKTGLKHGTLTVISDGEPVEVTTYRIDGKYADNRHPISVAFTNKLEKDLSRRDFTVNAMAYSPTHGLFDPFGGIMHLKQRLIACVGDPNERFDEDGLRILRALRFASVLDFEIDGATSAAVHKKAKLLDGISKERIYSELCRLICGNGAGRIFSEYGEALSHCFQGIIGAEVFTHAAARLSLLPKKSDCRLAYLIYLCHASPVLVCRALKASKREMIHISTLTGELSRVFALPPSGGLPDNDADIKRMMGRLSAEDILLIADSAEVLGYREAVKVFRKKYAAVSKMNPCVQISELNISGSDIQRITGAMGAEIGTILSGLLELVINDECENTPEALAAAAEKLHFQKYT